MEAERSEEAPLDAEPLGDPLGEPGEELMGEAPGGSLAATERFFFDIAVAPERRPAVRGCVGLSAGVEPSASPLDPAFAKRFRSRFSAATDPGEGIR